MTATRIADDLGSSAAGARGPGDPGRLDRRARRIAGVLLCVILLIIAVIVFWPGPPDADGQTALRRYLNYAHWHGLPRRIDYNLVQNLANVAMFLPIGLLGALALYRRNYLVVIYAGLASGLIESVQLILPDRVSSWQDITANTAGAFLGLLCAIPALRRRYKRRRQFLQGRRSAADSPRRAARAARL
jgi:VanZ family protein